MTKPPPLTRTNCRRSICSSLGDLWAPLAVDSLHAGMLRCHDGWLRPMSHITHCNGDRQAASCEYDSARTRPGGCIKLQRSRKGEPVNRSASAQAASVALCAALVLSLAACRSETGERTAAAASPPAVSTAAAGRDPYDLLEMDFKTPAAVLTDQRHIGAFATGD